MSPKILRHGARLLANHGNGSVERRAELDARLERKYGRDAIGNVGDWAWERRNRYVVRPYKDWTDDEVVLALLFLAEAAESGSLP